MAELQTQTVSSSRTVFVATDEPERGSKGPSYVVYSTEDAENRWDCLYGNCDSFDIAMDTMTRIEYDDCGSIRKPEEWDAIHEQPDVSARPFVNYWYGMT